MPSSGRLIASSVGLVVSSGLWWCLVVSSGGLIVSNDGLVVSSGGLVVSSGPSTRHEKR